MSHQAYQTIISQVLTYTNNRYKT